MKKIFYAVLVVGLLSSCASHPGRVCGGKGGGRCVDNTPVQHINHNKPIA
ncbi:hypothetical protein [Flavobacterium sp.]|nr:hypothetical protein [Flavobacterium sp.]MDI1316080.1 hypothetical protein [Flavobacterium sp.]